MNNNHYIYAACLFLLALLIGVFFAGRLTAPKNIEYVEKPLYLEKVKYDTITKTIALQTINKTFKGDSITYIDSTVKVLTAAFIASKDTIISGDTIGIKYAFPQDSFHFKLLPKPIVYKEITKTEYLVNIVKIERPLLIDIASHTGAGLFGGFIGYLIGKK